MRMGAKVKFYDDRGERDFCPINADILILLIRERAAEHLEFETYWREEWHDKLWNKIKGWFKS